MKQKQARTPFQAMIWKQGRRVDWLADHSTYGAQYISDVANGREPGSLRFFREMEAALGEKFEHPFNTVVEL